MINSERISLVVNRNSTKCKKSLYWMAAVFITFLSIPLFVNLKYFNLFLRQIQIEGYLQGGLEGIPFPFFGIFLVVIFLLVGLIKYRSIIKLLKRSDIVYFTSFALFLFIAIFSKYSIASILQLLLFPSLLWLVSFFNIDVKLAKYFLFGAISFTILHLMSILQLNNWSLTAPFPRHLVYESLFHYQIYQGLISYVNVLTVASVAILYILLKEKRTWITILLALALIIVLYVSSLSSQRQYAVDLLLITMFLIFICICNKGIQRRNKIVGFGAIFLVWCLSIFLVHNSAGASAPMRLLNTVLGINELYSDRVGVDFNLDDAMKRHGDVGMERLQHIQETFNSLNNRVRSNKLSGIIGGTGQVHSGSHNFILDLISGAGFLGAFAYFALLFGAFWRFARPCISKNTSLQLSFIILLFLMAGAGSMVNSPLTQPYYFLNLLFVAWFIASDIQTIKA